MTYIVKHKPQPGAPVMAEYECEDHGRFERLVARDDNGDPPATFPCPFGDDIDEETFFEDGCWDRIGYHPCEAPAELAISAPNIKFWSRDPVPIGRASKSDEWDPRALDTRPLAEGKMTKAEWRKWQRGISQERRYQKKLKAGKISKRIQVGGG